MLDGIFGGIKVISTTKASLFGKFITSIKYFWTLPGDLVALPMAQWLYTNYVQTAKYCKINLFTDDTLLLSSKSITMATSKHVKVECE